MSNIEKAYFAGGCFWGVEYYFKDEEGVVSTKVGYMGGDKQNPTYDDVCRGNTGHVETMRVEFDKSRVSFEKLLKIFFEIHDPTQKNRQGPDVGEQYKSAIFYIDDNQKETAEKVIKILINKGFDVVTELLPAGKFWEAENYHQKYYEKNGKKPYCHFRTTRF